MKTKMKRSIWSTVLICFAVLVCISSPVFAAVPEIINYQGSLSDDVGNPVNATLNITFTLYDAEVTGSNLWQEVQSVTITNGQFSVQFGANGGNPLDPTIFEDPIFLGVQVDADAEMTPRQKFTSTAFALKAKTVENDTLNSLSCAANEIPKFVGGVWSCAVDTDTNTNAATICAAGTFLNGDGTCDTITDTNTNAATLCPAGTFLNGDGTCDPVVVDTDTTYSAGSGLSLNGTTFSIPTAGIDATHLAFESVNSSEIADGAVGLSELAGSGRGVGVSGVIIIPASAFQPRLESSGYNISTNGYITPDSLNGFLCLEAPVALPHGVTVTSFEISVWDNAINNINVGTFSLRRVAFATGLSNTLGAATSSGASPSVRVFTDISISNAAVDAFANSYFITGCILADPFLTLNTRFYAARVRYN